jgi:agmatinase
MIKINYLNLNEEYSFKENSQIHIYPLSFKQKATTKNSSFNGPEEILKASREIEYFDEEFKIEPYLNGIYTHEIINLKNKDEGFILSEKIINKLKPLVEKNKLNIFLGSDHWTTHGIVSVFEKQYKDFGVISFDAHLDLREEWGKGTWWHACVLREISKKHKCLILGSRSSDFYENEYLKSNNSVSVISSREINRKKSLTHFKYFLKKLPKNIYITIDSDVFDPSIIRNTDTPEPNGLSWIQVNAFLKEIFKTKNVIGVDLVEFSPKGPEWNYHSEAYTLAKLIYKIISYKFNVK